MVFTKCKQSTSRFAQTAAVTFVFILSLFSDPYCIVKLYDDNREDVIDQSQTKIQKKVLGIVVFQHSIAGFRRKGVRSHAHALAHA